MSKITVLTPLQVSDHDVAGPTRPDDLAKLSAPLTGMLTSELDGAQHDLGVTTAELLVAALGRALARAIGAGELRVDVAGQRISLACLTTRQCDATDVLYAVHRTFTTTVHSVPNGAVLPADISFSYFDAGLEPSLVNVIPAGGHVLALRAYPSGDAMQLDWWYDARRLDQTTVEDLAEQFPLALIELTSEAGPPLHRDSLAMA